MSRFQKFTAFVISLLLSLSALDSQASGPGFSLEGTARAVTSLIPGSLSASQQNAVQKFLLETVQHLPPKLQQGLYKPLQIEFTALDSTSSFAPPACIGGTESTAQTLAKTQGSQKILLNLVMLPEILKGSEAATTYACGHRNLYQLAMASLIHQIARLYDAAEIPASPEKTAETQYCQNRLSDRDTNNQYEHSRCENLVNKHRVVSNDPSFLSLMNWDQYDRPLNFSSKRSPDRREYSNPEETFAVNMEYFLLDPDFACRRPNEQEYLRDLFSFDPFPNRTCQLPSKVELTRDSLGQVVGNGLVDIDPKRIYQVHFLYASKGSEAMSAWGHAMYRLIVCAPNHPVGPQCLDDVQEHIVISYRANPGNLFIDAWKGMTGYYPSEMFLYRFYPNVLNEYTIDEFRDLYSLPLNFTETEKNRFVERVIEQYWEYQGKYYFATNNCATEALRLLKGVVRDFDFQMAMLYTPSGLFDYLGKIHLIDMGLLKAPANTSFHNVFKSQKSLYEQDFAKIKAAAPNSRFNSMEDYAQHSSAPERRQLYESIQASRTADARMAYYFDALEIYIARNARKNFFDNTIQRLGTPQKAQVAPTAVQGKFVQLAQVSVNSLASNQIAQGYGVEQPKDLPEVSSEQKPENPKIQSLYSDVMSWAGKNLPAQANQVQSSTDNQTFFRQEITKNAPRN